MSVEVGSPHGDENGEDKEFPTVIPMDSNIKDEELKLEDLPNGHDGKFDESERKEKRFSASSFHNPAFEDTTEDLEANYANGTTLNGRDYQPPQPLSQNKEPFISKFFYTTKEKISNLYERFRRPLHILFWLLFTATYFVYLGFAVHISWDKSDSWCDGTKFLAIITIITVASLIYYFIIKKLFGKALQKCFAPLLRISNKVTSLRYCSFICFLIVMIVFLIVVLVDSNNSKTKFFRRISYAGVWTILLFGYVFSKHPSKVKFRHVAWGIGLQFVFALLILRWDVGKGIFQCLGDKVAAFLAFTDDGSSFMFNYLSTGQMSSGNASAHFLLVNGTVVWTNVTIVDLILPSQVNIFAFKVLPVVLFFSFCVSILYYWGVMQWVVMKVGWLLRVTVGTTAAESMNAAGNIFMGQTEAPLLVKPYLPIMTKSELHAIMTGGFATIAGSVLAAYISLGISASHLLSASVMSAPAALAFSKLFYPETEESKTTISEIKIEKGKERNALEAASNGVSQAIGLVANIAANLIAFIAFIYFVDTIISWFGNLVGWDFLSLTFILSKCFMPLAYMMGVKWEECDEVGKLIGLKTVINEFVAYDNLSKMKAGNDLSCRAQVISTYALCGFSNLSSIGIQLGGLGAMAPNKLSDLAQVAFRAMVSGSCACFLTACVAGSLIDVPDDTYVCLKS